MITPEQFQLLIVALNGVAEGLKAIAGAIAGLGTLGIFFLFFKKMG